ncbi:MULTISPECIES: Gfo/Idh/MocA family oxidoreductase [unclassified Sporosarcina]|uniref:Gfo/Idh/MocA family oxidoreductase n=1 Tax=unclassified Sporosarcina TaxID=2647733 RepID=UPI00203B2C0D|nr:MULTISPECIES: Gfo/Idh/MocA family oxidoreductase [unclassified Sporosarcina]GKV65859.1 scyllo-inositol 2-dehydrogenase (NAD(+)) [Sporosarcina sp. NCCP-2331]GLB55984.1 scyllo-inositol 2-dehydrogenase (NAD(+)) [Sporosarcina sp. NCCP-2378]
MKGNVKVAVLGLGRLGYWHAQNIATKIQGAEVVQVVDPLEGRAEQVAKELGISKWSTDVNSPFTNDEIDAVVIVTPTDVHAEMIKKAAENGKHIFVEKPLTSNLLEADGVIQSIEEHQVLCQVGFMRRFDPAYVEAKKRIKAGDIGKPLYFKAASRDGNVPPEQFIKHSGGIFLDVAIHDYDIARFLMEDEVHSILSTGNILNESNQFMEKYQDVDQGLSTIRFKSGAAADIETMRIAPYGYDIRGEVIGTEGAIQIGSMRTNDIRILRANQTSYDLVQDFPTRFQEAYLLEMIHFIQCIQTGEQPKCNALDGKKALEIATAATRSFRNGETVLLRNIEEKILG